MKITFLGHAAVKVEYNSHKILIDPFLNGNNQFTGDYLNTIADCTHIVLTHGHDDHIGDTLDIAQKTSATVIGMVELVKYLASQGIASIEPMNIGGEVQLADDISVVMVRADHSAATSDAQGVPICLGNAAGIMLKVAGKTLYHMGDTGMFSDMKLLADFYKPDVTFIPVGDRFTMGAAEATYACQHFLAACPLYVPMHYGTFPIIDATADNFTARMHSAGLGNKVKVLASMESLDI